MKKKNLHPGLIYILFTALFLFGFQQSAEAQFKVWNNTGCTINLKVGQRGGGCSVCNVSGVAAILPGATFVHPYNASCGPEYWLAFKYFTGTGSSVGISFNPAAGGFCGTDVNGNCGGSAITATWFSSTATGAGPTKVILQ